MLENWNTIMTVNIHACTPSKIFPFSLFGTTLRLSGYLKILSKCYEKTSPPTKF